MVVEDEPEIYDVLLAMFELWGVKGVSFVDGTEALAWIDDVDQGRVRRELPELALLDIRLHEVSGTQIAARLRRSPFLKDIPIVLITAFHLSPDQEARTIAEAQADQLMYKPLPSMPDLRRELDLLIERRKAAARPAEPPAAKPAPPAPEPGGAAR
jgi:CheY-like chemotaxis protein